MSAENEFKQWLMKLALQGAADDYAFEPDVHIYEGQQFVCSKHGHRLVVVYEDGFNALVRERNQLLRQVANLLDEEEHANLH